MESFRKNRAFALKTHFCRVNRALWSDRLNEEFDCFLFDYRGITRLAYRLLSQLSMKTQIKAQYQLADADARYILKGKNFDEKADRYEKLTKWMTKEAKSLVCIALEVRHGVLTRLRQLTPEKENSVTT